MTVILNRKRLIDEPRAAPPTLKQAAYERLKRALISGQFLPGQALTVRELSDMLGIGAMPVRESVQQLASEGGIEIMPNRTMRVALLTVQELDEVFEMRVALEGMAAARASRNATRAEVRAMRGNLKAAIAGLGSNRPAEGLLANMEFHFAVYKASRSATLVSTIERLWLRVGPRLILPYSVPERVRYHAEMLPAHNEFMRAIEAGDAESARGLCERILQTSWMFLRALPGG